MIAASRQSVAADPVGLLLPLLARVRQSGKGWRADCPVGHSSPGTLKVSVGDDGRVLMNCFAACTIAEITGALGIAIADLYPRNEKYELSASSRALRREFVSMAHWRAALGVLDKEATLVLVAASTILRSETLTATDLERLHLAANLIHDAREVLQ